MLIRSLFAKRCMSATARQFIARRGFAAVDSQLAKLRRKTGFAFALCRKALELHEQDLERAESWLREEAAREGWQRAERSQSRPTREGLIGVLCCAPPAGQSGAGDVSLAAMIEVNCETDFVARNQLFGALVSSLGRRLLSEMPLTVQHTDDNGNLGKIRLGGERLAELAADSTVAEAIARLGENIRVSRATVVVNNKREEGVRLVGYAHAIGGNAAAVEDGVLLGRYGAIVAVRDCGLALNEDGVEVAKSEEDVDQIARQLAQQIIGLNPRTIEPKSEVVEPEPTSLLQQRFVGDDDLTVAEWLKQVNVRILDFERFECGVDEL